MSPAEQAERLHRVLETYNWDDGLELPARIARSPECDLALALELFYLADGVAWLEALQKGHSPQGSEDWRCLLSALYAGLLSGRYPRTGRLYAVPLNRAQRFRYAKAGIPHIFLENV